MARSNVYITKTNGGLGKKAANTDGVSALVTTGVAVAGKLVLNTVYKLNSLAALEALGVDKAYDTTNKTVIWDAVRKFYAYAPGVELCLLVAAQTNTLTQLADKANAFAKKVSLEGNGVVKNIAISRNPATGYTPTLTAGLDADVIAAIPKAQALVEEEALAYRYINVILEGRSYNGTATAATDLKALGVNSGANVCVVIGADPAVSSRDALINGYADVGSVLGIAAAQAVSQNIGERKEAYNLKVAAESLWLTAGLSNNLAITAITEADLDTLHTKGYIFAERVAGLDGYWLCDDTTCVVATSDYSSLAANRTVNKALTLARAALLPNVNARLYVNSTNGQVSNAEIARLETLTEGSLQIMLQDGDLSGGIEAFVDPLQNLLNTSDLVVELSFVPVAIGKRITLKIGMKNPTK